MNEKICNIAQAAYIWMKTNIQPRIIDDDFGIWFSFPSTDEVKSAISDLIKPISVPFEIFTGYESMLRFQIMERFGQIPTLLE